jgi:hypothetical protein
MRALALALCLLILVPFLAPASAAEDFGAVAKVNKLINVRETPQLAPGESGRFTFYLNSTYTEAVQTVRLNATIYRYATIDESFAVDSGWSYPYPQIAESTSPGRREWIWTTPNLPAGNPNLLNFTVLTAANSRDMPHGTVFSQSSYFVRFWLEFTNNGTRYRMVSPGFFTQAQWTAAVVPAADPCNLPDCRGHMNVTRLAGFLGVPRVDGIISDSAFGVKEPIPRWPFYLLIALVAVFLLLAFLFWVEENPGTFPRVEAWWARTRGRLRRTIAPLRPHRKPKA